jgi:hypothetical protein
MIADRNMVFKTNYHTKYISYDISLRTSAAGRSKLTFVDKVKLVISEKPRKSAGGGLAG